jgi:hypothetical protein
MGNEFSSGRYNECLVTYILAASSPTHSIDAETYYKGWTRNRTYLTDKTKYGLPLYVKHNYAEEYGGPLFWSQYSYIGLDPTGLSDKLVKNYFDLNKNHTLLIINTVLRIQNNGKAMVRTIGD